MKRNESILVYGVTGLLLLIVIIAVVFGDPAPARANVAASDSAREEGSARDLTELPGMVGVNDPAGSLGATPDTDADAGSGDPAAGDPAARGDSAGPDSPGPDGAGPGRAGPDGAQPGAGAGADGPAVGATDPAAVDGGVPLGDPAAAAGGVALDWRVAPADAAALPPLGVSERTGDYRLVTVRAGDTFSTLVMKWCGSLDAMAEAEALNEMLDRDNLRAGSKVLLPWVDEAELLQMRKNRTADVVRARVVGSKVYEVRGGDSLWAIAARSVGAQNKVPSYIRQILDLNPGLSPDRLRVGQKIVLP